MDMKITRYSNFWIGIGLLSFFTVVAVIGAIGLYLTEYIVFMGLAALYIGFRCIDNAEEKLLIDSMKK